MNEAPRHDDGASGLLTQIAVDPLPGIFHEACEATSGRDRALGGVIIGR